MFPTQSGSRESQASPSLGRRQLLTYAAFGSAALPARIQPISDWGAVFVALAAIATIALAYG